LEDCFNVPVESIFLNWFEKVGSTQYRCKRDACVGLIEAIAESYVPTSVCSHICSGDIETWIPEAQMAFNSDPKRKGRDLIWDKLNDTSITHVTPSLTLQARISVTRRERGVLHSLLLS
jgi:hypothetical protein